MQDLFKKYNLELEDHEMKKFEKFLEIFKEKNSQVNLSAIRDDEGIIEKHFIDSILLNVFLDFEPIFEGQKVKVADL
jgi:16S rRNA (guanine527-N7)-methyltransferase